MRTRSITGPDIKRSSTAIYALVISTLFLGVLIPWLNDVQDTLTLVLLVLNILTCAIGGAFAMTSGLRPLHLIWFVFSYIWLLMGATYQISHGILAWNDSRLLFETGKIRMGLLVILVANLAFLASARSIRARTQGLFSSGVQVKARVPWILTLVCLAISPYVIATNGGLLSFFTSRYARRDARESAGIDLADGGGPINALVSQFPAALPVAALLLFLLARRWGTPVKWDKCGIALSGAMACIFANPISSTRFLSMAAICAIAYFVLSPRSVRAARRLAVMLFILMFGAYPLGNIFRRGVGGGSEASFGLEALGTADFDGFQQVVNAWTYWSDLGLQWGRHVVSAVFFFVPRSIVPDKAWPASIDVAEHRGYFFTNLSLPFYAELLIDLGPVLAIVAVFYFGRMCARLDQNWLLGQRTRAVALMPYAAFAQIGILRGPLGATTPIFLTVLILIWIGLRPSATTEDEASGSRTRDRHSSRFNRNILLDDELGRPRGLEPSVGSPNSVP